MNQLQSMEKKPVRESSDDDDVGFEGDIEEGSTEKIDEELKQLVDLIKSGELQNGGNKRRRLSFRY